MQLDASLHSAKMVKLGSRVFSLNYPQQSLTKGLKAIALHKNSLVSSATYTF